MQPVSASRKSSSQFSPHSISQSSMSTCFSPLKEATMPRKAQGIVREISHSAAADRRLKMRRGNVLSLTKDDWRTTLSANKFLSKRQGVRRGKPRARHDQQDTTK